MSYIVGGGGGGGGLTEDEVKTLIGRGKANGTAGLDSSKNLLVAGNVIYMKNSGSAGSCNLYSGSERVFEAQRVKANDYRIRQNRDNTLMALLDASDRNGATSTGVAGIYNPCKTLLNEHRPVCTKEYHLTGKYLDGADNPDVWFSIKGVGANAAVTYANRVLTLDSGSGTVSASRCVIDQTKFPITGNFLEVTCEIGNFTLGEGGNRFFIIGFKSAFSDIAGYDRICFLFTASQNKWSCADTAGVYNIVNSPLARELQSGDIVTVRLDRQEGSPDIDIARFYVNGQKIHETTKIPNVDLYAGIGAFAGNSLVDVGCSIGIKYFGVRYVP